MWKLSKLYEMYDNKVKIILKTMKKYQMCQKWKKKKMKKIKIEKNPHCMVCTGL